MLRHDDVDDLLDPGRTARVRRLLWLVLVGVTVLITTWVLANDGGEPAHAQDVPITDCWPDQGAP